MFAAGPKADVEAACAAWDDFFNKGDAKSIAAAYLPSAKLLPPSHQMALGQASIEKFYTEALANGITDHKVEVMDAGGDGKIVYAVARWSAKGKDNDGKLATFSGFATYVFEREADNSLKLLLQTWN
jgi:ketosteroid isomerase-like protein